MRVLDLGCGDGKTPQKLGLPPAWRIIGVDLQYSSLAKAHFDFPGRNFICAAAEQLPFPDGSFDQVICNVALPYMNIARTLRQVRRVLLPGGLFFASLHALPFTLSELRNVYRRNPKASLYRLWVLANGIAFHFSGYNFAEAFQTERGMRIALRRAGFEAVSFRHDPKRWIVEARKPVASI
jgi:ubiquinone/menaquinone biosynthesis C-methylase UbiE